MRKKELNDRLLDFSFEIILLSRSIGASRESKVIFYQMIKSSTSMGANYNEAKNACSKKDFLNKFYIIKKEAQETEYWLNLASRCFPNNLKIQSLKIEALELVKIFQKSITTIKQK